MNKSIIVENLSKEYLISQKNTLGQAGRYSTLRDSIASYFKQSKNNIKSFLKGQQLTYGDYNSTFYALKNINLELNAGDHLGIVGKNGAGKSTLLKILSRVTAPTAGKIIINGKLSSLLEVGTGFNPELTARENIYLNGAILGMKKKEIDKNFDEIVDFADVEYFIDTPVKRFSSGMYVRLAFAVAAHLNPDILIIDEVLAVGDIKFRKKCIDKINSEKTKNRTIIFVSHDLSTVKSLCSKAILMDKGQITHSGTAKEIIDIYQKNNDSKFSNLQSIVSRKINTNKFFLKRVKLFNSKKINTAVFNSDEFMSFELESNIFPPQSDFSIEYFIYNETGFMISTGNSSPMCNKSYSKNIKKFRCTLGPLYLTTGYYSLGFSIRIWGQERWDFWDNAIFFRIDNCDIFKAGYNQPNGPGGDFIIGQTWS